MFKVELLGKILGVGWLCVLFGGEFVKVNKIVGGLVYVLFKEEGEFAQLVKKTAKDALRPICVSLENKFVKVAKGLVFCQPSLAPFIPS